MTTNTSCIRRKGQYRQRLHGEKKDSDLSAADHWVTHVLPDLLETYQPQDICNADETGLYYRTLPDATLTQKTEQLWW